MATALNNDHLSASLLAAIADGSTDQVRELLTRGAVVPLRREFVVGDISDESPCDNAARLARLELLDVLLVAAKPQLDTLEPSCIEVSSFWSRLLTTAIDSGNPAVVELVIDKIGNPDSAILTDSLPLFHAIKSDNVTIVNLLLAHDVSLYVRNVVGQNALHIAADRNAVDCIDLLLDASNELKNAVDKQGHTPIHYAVQFGHIEATKRLIHAGANANIASVKLVTPLHVAVDNGRRDLVELLLVEGKADPSAKGLGGKTPLHAVFTIDRDLLDNDSDETMGDNDSDDMDADGAEQAQLELATLLLTHDADPNVLDSVAGFSPLHTAIRHECERTLKVLLAHGADPNMRTAGGLTALHVAALFDASADAWQSLLEYGADVKAVDADGKTALELVADPDTAAELGKLIQ